MERHECGCPTERYKYAQLCINHAQGRARLPWTRDAYGLNHGMSEWQTKQCCQYCGRVHGAEREGIVCDQVEHKPGCSLVTCWGQHRMGHYYLGTVCPDAEAHKYIKRIRNATKQVYAKKYWEHLATYGPDSNGPEYGSLSFMAAQAVRMQLNQILNPHA